MKPLSFHRLALKEIDEAAANYDRELPGIGNAFVVAIEELAARIRRHSQRFSFHRRVFRKALVKRFPYTHYFREFENEILIVSVAHQKRRPDYWIRRK